VGEKVRGFWLGLMDRVAPVLSRLLDGSLAFSLLKAGQWFGEKIADAAAVLYQLAKDGELWGALKDGFQLAFDYAGERLLWLGKIGYGVLKEVFSQAFLDGVTDALAKSWESVTSFSKNFGDVLGTAFWSVWVEIKAAIYAMLNKLGPIGKKFGAQSTWGDEGSIADRNQEIASDREANANNVRALAKPNGADVWSRIANVLKDNQFSPSGQLGNQISKLKEVVSSSLTKYKADEKARPTQAFENNSRIGAFGVDSMAAIGGGGGVYLGLTVLDVNRRQLRHLEEINQKLGGANSGQTQNIINQYSPLSNNISRAQTGSVVTTN